MAALGRFISHSTEKGLHFFKTLRSIYDFKWTNEAQATLKALKAYLSSPSLLTNLKPGETLLLYLAATLAAASATLVKKKDWHQCQIYYISEALAGANERYT